jgi:MFS transporter, PPP family, 3-phenylpropionic acid transporter
MAPDPQIPTASTSLASAVTAKRFATWLAVFYAALFGLVGTHLPFFPVWLKAIGIEASWIGIITAVPSLTRFTVLPFITSLAEKRQALRHAMIATAVASALGFAVIGTLHQPLAILLAYAITACLWTPMTPLTDAYALKGVSRYGLNYGPLRLWGSAAFVAGAIACGILVDVIAARHLIWVIVAVAALGAIVSLGLRPVEQSGSARASSESATALLQNPGFLAIIVAAALIQGSHAAYYTFASIAWQNAGLTGVTIASLWALGVVAEIVVFALSPRFTLSPATLVIIAALSAVARWAITAQEPPLELLAIVQLAHGATFGLTQIGTMGLLVQHVPSHVMARAQGYLTACTGIATSLASVLSGAIYARHGQGVYYLMTAMALVSATVMWVARQRLQAQPQSDASGG